MVEHGVPADAPQMRDEYRRVKGDQLHQGLGHHAVEVQGPGQPDDEALDETGQFGDKADETVIVLAGRSLDLIDALRHLVLDVGQPVIFVEPDTGDGFNPVIRERSLDHVEDIKGVVLVEPAAGDKTVEIGPAEEGVEETGGDDVEDGDPHPLLPLHPYVLLDIFDTVGLAVVNSRFIATTHDIGHDIAYGVAAVLDECAVTSSVEHSGYSLPRSR